MASLPKIVKAQNKRNQPTKEAVEAAEKRNKNEFFCKWKSWKQHDSVKFNRLNAVENYNEIGAARENHTRQICTLAQ